MNRKSFLKLISFGTAFGCIKPVLGSEKNIDKKVTIYGYDWKYESYDFDRYFRYKCKFYPNKTNRKEYIYFPPKHRGEYIYNYEKGIKTTYIPSQIDGMMYIKNGKHFKIKKEYSTHVGFCDDICCKIEFII